MNRNSSQNKKIRRANARPGVKNPARNGAALPNTGKAARAVMPLLNPVMRSGTGFAERALPLFPPRFKALLRYATPVTLTSTSGAVATQVFTANGLFDPDITGTGHQPAGFDQMMLSYEHYVVTGARVIAVFHNVTSTVAAPRCAIALASSATPVTIVDQILEDGLVVTDSLNPSGQYGSIKTLESAINIARFGGVDDLMDNPFYRGDIASNPTEQQYFHLQLWCSELVTTVSGVEVVIEYEAVFKEPRRLTESLSAQMRKAILHECKTR